jgi:Putative lumazine-binding
VIAQLLLLLAAVSPSSKLPPAEALPPPASDEQAVLVPINQFFAAMTAKDGARILAQVRADGRLAGVSEEGVKSSSWGEFTARFKPGEGPALEERLVGAPAIEVDGDIAMVWSPYVFLIDGKLSHCGTDHFDLVRDAGQWKVLNITWSKRTTDCPAQ